MSPISLRDHEEIDFEDTYEMASDPLVQGFLGGTKSREESRKGFDFVLLNRGKRKYPLKAIVHNDANKVIGYCGMQPLKDFGPELFFGLNSKYWGNGYCSQAGRLYLKNESQGESNIFATVHPDNERSRRVLERLGFLIQKEIYYEPMKMNHLLYLWTKQTETN